MPRKYVRKTERQKWDEKNMENAIKAALKKQLTCVEAMFVQLTEYVFKKMFYMYKLLQY